MQSARKVLVNDDIEICGIRTNNLKGFDVKLKRNSINLIIGPSGSGKSSLAYDTVAQIGLHELNSLCNDSDSEPNFKVSSYKNMLVTVPIKQLNTNSNVRSTIGTYFNLNHYITVLFSSILNIPYSAFVLNKTENFCQTCKGLGTIKAPDVQKIVNYSVPLNQNPFRCYRIHKEFYCEIIKKFCDEKNIDSSKCFKDLNDSESQELLNGTSKKKYQVKYQRTKYVASRTSYYYGVLNLEKHMMPDFTLAESFYSDVVCPECSGEKFNTEKRQFKVCKKSIGEVLNLPFSELLKWLEDVKAKKLAEMSDFSLTQLINFCKKTVELRLDYLFLNRTIPSLSGGELQRLRLAKLFTTQLKDLLIILDEPLAGLSQLEKGIIYKNVKQLVPKNTLLIVDHHDIFFKDASQIITLGEKSGILGGNLIDTNKYINSLKSATAFSAKKCSEFESVNIEKSVYKYKGAKLQIAKNAMNIITGASGIGKSTLLREYLPLYFDDYEYINQKPLAGNKDSNVATSLGVFTLITNIFAKKFKKERTFFSNHTGDKGCCPSCSGSGIQFYNNSAVNFVYECKECKGSGFNQELLKYKIDGKSIIDVMAMTIDEAVAYFNADKKIASLLESASSILLGSLVMGQKMSTLSGGENVRIKILRAWKSSSSVLGIDEPFRGLNKNEICHVANYLTSLLDEKKTIIVIDHEEEGFKYFSNKQELKNIDNVLIGK